MIEAPNKKRFRAESEIELFLRLFPILAAHFELKSDLTSAGFLEFFRDAAVVLAEEYEDALDNELQSDESFVAKLPSVLLLPKVKEPILDDE